jgi:hypothetical protein
VTDKGLISFYKNRDYTVLIWYEHISRKCRSEEVEIINEYKKSFDFTNWK